MKPLSTSFAELLGVEEHGVQHGQAQDCVSKAKDEGWNVVGNQELTGVYCECDGRDRE
jgi:hypothetical protein